MRKLDTRCHCIHCKWQKKKPSAVFTDFYRDWLRDNIQYAGITPLLTEVGDNLELYAPNAQQFQELPPGSPLAILPESARMEHVEYLEGEAKRESQRGSALSSSFPPKLTAPKSQGFEWFKIYEHKIQTGWRCATEARPPVPSGQRFSLHLSQKSRRKLLETCHAFGRHFKKPTFVTLTYGESVCQSVAKAHFDTWWKRVKRATGRTHYVWVAELQKRGVIHFHILIAGWLHWEPWTKAWHEITGGKNHTHFAEVRSPFAYMAKYFGKTIAQVVDCHGEIRDAVRPEPIVGRRWGASGDVIQWRKPLMESYSPKDFSEWVNSRPQGQEWTAFDFMSTRPTQEGEILSGWNNLDVHKLLKK